MSDNILTAIITASSTTLVAITAIAINTYWVGKRFDDMNRRFDDMSRRIDKIEATLEIIQGDLKQFYRDIILLKQKTGLE